jgi:single-stranded DNA-binding protein
MLSILASGTLVADPVSRTSAAGKPYATCTMRVPCEDSDAVLVSIITFASDAVAALLALAKGDSCAIAGRAKLTAWEKDGTEHHGLSVVADRVLSAYAAGKLRKASREAAEA